MDRQNKRFIWKRIISITFVCMFVLCMACPQQVEAASKKNTWKTQKGYTYYYDENGKKATGLTEIGSKTYYFDKKGVMQTGWQKIKGDYYYFDRSNGKQIKNKTVDGIKIKKDGTVKKTK